MMIRQYYRNVVLATFLALASAIPHAQKEISRPSFIGSIVDKTERAPIAGAHVWIHEERGRASYVAVSDDRGHFEYTLLEGYYDVMVSSPGFAPFCKKVWIKPGVPATLNVVLDVSDDTLQD